MTIQPAQPEHSTVLTEIAVSAKRHWNYPEKWIELWLPALTISPGYICAHETWMAVSNNKPVGFYALTAGAELELDHFWVLPEFMGQGIGRRLFLHAVERCHLRAAQVLRIEADPNAVGFYEKMGARKVGEHQSEVDGQPRILPIMEINL